MLLQREHMVGPPTLLQRILLEESHESLVQLRPRSTGKRRGVSERFDARSRSYKEESFGGMCFDDGHRDVLVINCGVS